MAIAPPEMALPADITPLALADLPMIHFEGGNTRRIIDDWFARDGVPVRPVMSLDSSEGIKELVAAGLGSAILPKMALKEGSSCGMSPRQLAGGVWYASVRTRAAAHETKDHVTCYV